MVAKDLKPEEALVLTTIVRSHPGLTEETLQLGLGLDRKRLQQILKKLDSKGLIDRHASGEIEAFDA